MDDLIHIQTSRIGLIAAEIAKTLASPELTSRANIDCLAHKLEVWQSELPLVLQMATLTSPQSPTLTLYQRRAIFMVHVRFPIVEDVARKLMLRLDDVPRSTHIALPDTPRGRCRDSAH
jgi:hypothetical protein